jgi:acetate kinase
MSILAVNAGSSSLKFSLYPMDGAGVAGSVISGQFQGLEPHGTPQMDWKTATQSAKQALNGSGDPFTVALEHLRQLLASMPDLPPLKAVAHRVVHGANLYQQSILVDDQALQALEGLNSLAPLHQPHNIEGIKAFRQAFPDLPQVACFDTAFHTSVKPEQYEFALPQALTKQGVRRYGFHGLSYQFIIGQLLARTPKAKGRVLMAHLGNGASLCAAFDGCSQATTMGFSALDGLMMGTRSGSLDAGVLLYLLEQGWTHDRLQALLYKESGLLGVSGLSADMRKLRQSDSPDARHAIDLFTHRVIRESGAMIACLKGLDVIAFSGGIGEHDAQLRHDVCQALGWLGVNLDEALNMQAIGDQAIAIHAHDSAIEVWVIPTDEGFVAAREAAALIAKA